MLASTALSFTERVAIAETPPEASPVEGFNLGGAVIERKDVEVDTTRTLSVGFRPRSFLGLDTIFRSQCTNYNDINISPIYGKCEIPTNLGSMDYPLEIQ